MWFFQQNIDQGEEQEVELQSLHQQEGNRNGQSGISIGLFVMIVKGIG